MTEVYKRFTCVDETDCVFVGSEEECKRVKAILIGHYKDHLYKPDVFIYGRSVKEGSEQEYIGKVLSGELEYGGGL